MSIEELANKYVEGSSFEDAVMERIAYKAGANKVLQEIWEIIDMVPYPETQYPSIVDKIKELRGDG